MTSYEAMTGDVEELSERKMEKKFINRKGLSDIWM